MGPITLRRNSNGCRFGMLGPSSTGQRTPGPDISTPPNWGNIKSLQPSQDRSSAATATGTDHAKPEHDNDDRKGTSASVHTQPRVGNPDEQLWGIPKSGVADHRGVPLVA